MKKYIFTILVALLVNISNSQVFIPLDLDTHEFIDEVNYSLFLNKKLVFNAVSDSKNVTTIDNKINYDSISFSRIDYKTFGTSRTKLDTIIFLEKKIIYLDEAVVVAKNKSLTLGEVNRFVKKQSKAIDTEIYFGIVFTNEFKNEIAINKIVFFTEKVFYKTLYKINFYEVDKTLPIKGKQYANFGNLFYATDTLSLYKNNSKKVEVDINSNLLLSPNKDVFVAIELLNYFDDDNTIIKPVYEKLTKIKFQLSDKTDFYSKLIDFFTKKESDKLINVNLMINYDFANNYFKKPHKSILVAPAILLYVKEL